MRLSIRASKMRLSPRMRSYIERRVYFTLSRFGGRVTRVQVGLSQVSGPRRGVERSCKVVVTVRGAGPVVVEHRDSRVTLAVDHALARVARGVGRTVELSDGRLTVTDGLRARPEGRR